jgi:DNA modification methylase
MTKNTVIQADCIEWLRGRQRFADLIFADPPFNIGYKYDVYADTKAYQEYYDWTVEWMSACEKVLAVTGAFWVAIGAEYAAEVRMIGRQLGLCLRNWVIWHYTFGQNTKAKFARAHTHLFYFTRSPTDFTFNADQVRVMSDRQKEYQDRRANPLGKLPFDVWTEFSRVCGTFGERQGWHPCQMPEVVLARIVRACSNPGDLVFDPFAGSGTTLVVAKKMGRHYVGTEFSADYVAGIKTRLAAVDKPGAARGAWPAVHLEELASLYQETGLSTDQLYENPYLFGTFCAQFNLRMTSLPGGGEYTPAQIWGRLERMRGDLKLARIKTHAQEPTSKTARPTPPTSSRRIRRAKAQQMMRGRLFGPGEE